MADITKIDHEACWKFLGNAMLRECDRMNHHFRCAAGEVGFLWLTKHVMSASANDFPRLVITKGRAEGGQAFFATHFYPDEKALAEHYVLTIDKQMTCRLSDAGQRVTLSAMCRLFFEALCTASPGRLRQMAAETKERSAREKG